MLYYPYDLEGPNPNDPEDDGGYLLTFPDVEMCAAGGFTEQEALEDAYGALLGGFRNHLDSKTPIPMPSPANGRPCVRVPLLVGAKIELVNAFLASGLTRVALGEKLGKPESTIRRMLDFDHRSHIGEIETALEVLGRNLVLVSEAA